MDLPLQSPLTVISGGQTGADIAGLVAAQKAGIPTTGWAPKGFRTERGNKPILKTNYNLIEHESRDYGPRTMLNAAAADITFIFSTDKHSPGTKKTIEACINSGCAYVVYDEFSEQTTANIKAYLTLMQAMVINVAGNRESKSPGIAKQVVKVLQPALEAYFHDITQNGLTTHYRHAKESQNG